TWRLTRRFAGSSDGYVRRRSLCSQTQVVAEPHAANSERDLADDVPERRLMIAAVSKRERVEAEAGEGGETTKHADEDKRSGECAERKTTPRNASRQQADHQTADHIDCENRPRHRPFKPMRERKTDIVTGH